MGPLALLTLVSLFACTSVDAGDGPVELGTVSWLRDHDAAFAKAAQADRPVLLLFQEIPG